MTYDGAAFQPGTEEARVPFRPRGTYAGYRAFGSGNGAVLIDPKVTRELRSAAEFATQERRITGGLLYGRGWSDEQGVYLVINGYEEAGPGENSADGIAADGTDNFTLSAADLRLLREDGSRMYSGDIEAGWWRSLAGLGEFGPQDFETQAELVGPGGVGLLVYGSGVHWGTAYLGPDSQAPDSAGTLAATPPPAPAPAPAPPRGPEPQAGPAAGHVPREEAADSAAGEILAPHPLHAGPGPAPAAPPTAPPPSPQAWPSPQAGPSPQPAPPPQAPPPPARAARPARRRAAPRVSARRWVARPTGPDQGPETPGDVKFVVGALVAAAAAVAIIIGVLVHSALVAVIIAVVAFVVILSTVWLSRR